MRAIMTVCSIGFAVVLGTAGCGSADEASVNPDGAAGSGTDVGEQGAAPRRGTSGADSGAGGTGGATGSGGSAGGSTGSATASSVETKPVTVTTTGTSSATAGSDTAVTTGTGTATASSRDGGISTATGSSTGTATGASLDGGAITVTVTRTVTLRDGGLGGLGGRGGSGGIAGAGGSGGIAGAGGSGGTLDKMCGGIAAIPCDKAQFCELEDGACGTGADLSGTCVTVTSMCPLIYSPVCGCDGKTYSNDCVRRSASVSKRSDGACRAVIEK